MRLLIRFLLAVALAITALFAWMHHEARADPVVRRLDVALPDWPLAAKPVTVVLISDIHLRSTAMDPPRLERIVTQIDALHPDLVLMAGDFIYGHDLRKGPLYARQLIAPLSRLHAPLGVIAVPGNHDYWAGGGAVRPALAAAGVTWLENTAVERGPLAIGGVGDGYTHHDDARATMVALDRLPGAKIVVTHSPDTTRTVPPRVSLVLAGHTHCGQAVWPIIGPLPVVAHKDYLCGPVRQGGQLTIVSAGLGTSGPPLRLRAPPDLWLLTLGPVGPR
jgi:predicted MPP superfamily phosphohydrolase